MKGEIWHGARYGGIDFLKVGIINVGVNASHGSLMSPIFDDGTLEFVPIPIRVEREEHPIFPKYKELFSTSGKEHADFIPPQFLEIRTHNDPELISFTYGDFPTRSPRASNLRKLDVGDQLFFLARLVRWSDGCFTSKAGFYLIGFLEIEQIFNEDELVEIANLRRFDEQFKKIQKNGHVLMMKEFTDIWLRESPEGWKGSWVFLGSKNSRRFKYAVPFDRTLADEVMLDAHGRKWTWPQTQTDLQRIGSYTRSCRIMEDRSRIEKLWKVIGSYDSTPS